MSEIECLVCGKTVKMPQFIDTDNYDGQLVCLNCNSLLPIKSKVRKYKVVENKRARDVKIILKPAYPKESEDKEKELNESQREASPLFYK